MKTFVTILLLVLVVVDGQKKSNEYVSIFKRKHLFPVFFFWIVDKGAVGEFGGFFFLAIYYFDEGTCKKGLWRVLNCSWHQKTNSTIHEFKVLQNVKKKA